MKRRNKILASALGLVVLVVLTLHLRGWSLMTFAGVALNTARTATDPPGTMVVEYSKARVVGQTARPGTAPRADIRSVDAESWPSYNRTLTSQRYSPLSKINTQTVRGLKVQCIYDTQLHESFETGPLMVDGALIGTTAFDTFSLDPSNCRENWRTHEENVGTPHLQVNRGAAYSGGRLFRGTLDGRVVAYDFKTGRRLWSATIADPRKSEIVDAAPIAWNGLVFIGVAGGDMKALKGRVYALMAETGAIVWEAYMVPKTDADVARGPAAPMPASSITSWGNAPDVPITGGGTWTSYTLDPATGRLYIPVGNSAPDYVDSVREGANLYTNTVLALDAKTGAYINHLSSAPMDWHDWDVSNAPAINMTWGGKQLLSFAPKNGRLYGIDLATNQLLYRSPVTRIENADVPLSTDKGIHFCPGVSGGGEWNGVAYDPGTNLLLTGEAEWCTTVKLQTDAQVKAVANGGLWAGHAASTRLGIFGVQDPHANWAGWLYATDADSGEWKWRVKTNYPILSGVTPTGGGLVFFGDMGGNFYAVDANNGQRLWSRKLAGAIGGGVITYMAGGSQKVAVAAGMTLIIWPTEQTTAKIVILGLGDPAP